MSDVRLRPAYRGQADPHHRHALGFEHADHLFDLLGVEFDPAFLAEFIEAVRRARALFRRDRRRCIVGGVIRRQFGVDRFVVGLRAGLAIRLRRVRRAWPPVWRGRPSCRSSLAFVGFLGRRLVDRDAVVEPEHDDDGFGFLGRENALGGGGPVGRLAPGLIFDQPGIRSCACGSRRCRAGRHRHPRGRRRASPPWRRRAPARCAPARSRASPAAAPWKNPRGPPASAPAAGTARTGRRRTSRRRRCRCAAAAAAVRRN